MCEMGYAKRVDENKRNMEAKPVHVHVCVGVCIRVCVADMLRVWLGVDCKMLINMSRCCRLTV